MLVLPTIGRCRATRPIAIATFAAFMAASTAVAAPGLGGQIFATGGPVSVEVLPPGGAFTSQLWLDSPGPPQFLGVNSMQTGAVVPVGSFNPGDELVFAILVLNTGDYFKLGPASRNADNVVHGNVVDVTPGVVDALFEDLFGGGDLDYNDANFRVRGHVASSFGACCISGRCYQGSMARCRAHGGNFLGDGTNCHGRDCTRGACCIGDGCHGPGPQHVCQAHGGAYQGHGTLCSDVNCDRHRCDRPGVCGTFELGCLGQPNCACATLAEGGGRCAADAACNSATPCPGGSGQCPPGFRCYVNTCCGFPVCLRDCLGGAPPPLEDDPDGSPSAFSD
jgi:hypothetical protein